MSEQKIRALRATITDQMGQISDLQELLIAALPYVEAGQDEPEATEAGKARARKLAANIRVAVEAMNGGGR